jgi:LIVCS family branched-chain amino acid:cation transporter
MEKTQDIKLQKNSLAGLFTSGFALFSMFFGAGNLIFPILIGRLAGADWVFAILGLSLTAVLVPFLGLATMIFFDADCNRFLARIGKTPGFLLFLLLQMILGPFGVIPRLFTLMHAILKPYIGQISSFHFSVLAALVVFVFTVRKQNIIKILGMVLTPILIGCLCCLFASGFMSVPNQTISGMGPLKSFKTGLLGGYNTMDLIAAFLFATVVLPHFKNESLDTNLVTYKKNLYKKIFFSSLIAATLLLFTYIGISYISAYHSHTVAANLPPEEVLGAIAEKLLGPFGGAIAASTIVTACLTTAITLASIFADYLKKDLLKDRVDSKQSLLITLLITIFFANLGFTGIARFLGPILEICYPGLIVLTLFNLANYFKGIKTIKLPVFVTFLFSSILYIAKNFF